MTVTLTFCGKVVTLKSTDTVLSGSVSSAEAAVSLIPRDLGYYLRTVIAFSLTHASGPCHELSRSCRSQFDSVEKDCFLAVTASFAASFSTKFQG